MNAEQLERLHLIASGDRDCDMSENDLDALRALLMEFEAMKAGQRAAFMAGIAVHSPYPSGNAIDEGEWDRFLKYGGN